MLLSGLMAIESNNQILKERSIMLSNQPHQNYLPRCKMAGGIKGRYTLSMDCSIVLRRVRGLLHDVWDFNPAFLQSLCLLGFGGNLCI